LSLCLPKRRSPIPEPTSRAEPIWLEAYPDILLAGMPKDAPDPGPTILLGSGRDQRASASAT
jgi:hypothetical protein